ncbi:DEAD/DEAH box helicase [Methylocystis sp. WRRC1]|uniref:DEAD/DEAH box helicase n=1 Tax=unclassified Methylocystis TaxID=2625913 RepID=UPI0001F888B5|nr:MULTISPECIES: DEAD/DEAH box helicase [unclassified Methylocystis]MCC3247248.1 DEAD/DEAH box helicase [Methylocystis sp. WRRC1]
MTFDELGLSQKVLAAVQASGYTTPTPIQAQAIPPALQGRDILGIAQTGTGKTAAFTLPMLSRLEQGRARARVPRTLILEPTRELAAQVEESFAKYGANHKLNVALLIGGVSFGDQEAKIMRGADVLIATPGRLLDFFDRGKLLLTGIEILVIDEADRMLDMGFIPDIERVCKLVPFTRQTLFFSATMPPEITRLTEAFLHNPIRIEVARASTTASTIRQALVASRGHADKRETLRNLIRGAENLKNAIVFCNRKRDVAILHRSLVKHGFPAGALHGDMDQLARMASLDAFKNGDVAILVCSDVAARGLDIPDVSHVFNFDVPTHSEDYVHRIGRTGRAGRSGVAMTIVTEDDTKYIDQIQSLIGKAIEWEGPGFDALPPPMETSRPGERHGERGGRRERGGRGERGSRRQAPATEREAPPSIGRTPRAVRQHTDNGPVRAPRPSAQPVALSSGDRRDRRPRRYHEDDGPPVIGLGDHVPSFLLRPVTLRPAKVGEE